jgi:prophage regulatory protein
MSLGKVVADSGPPSTNNAVGSQFRFILAARHTENQTRSGVACRHRGFRMSADSPEAHRRILRRPEVEARCGFKRAHLYKLIDEGKFPRPVRIGVRAVGWDSVEIEQWITDQLQRRT